MSEVTCFCETCAGEVTMSDGHTEAARPGRVATFGCAVWMAVAGKTEAFRQDVEGF